VEALGYPGNTVYTYDHLPVVLMKRNSNLVKKIIEPLYFGPRNIGRRDVRRS
jgi:hypothetical protein